MFVDVDGQIFFVRESGGPGSGNWGHLGIPGYHGGSQAGSGGVHARPENYKEKKGITEKKTEPGRVPDVEYLREEYPNSPGFGLSHPLATPSGIDEMQSDFSKANVNLPIAKATQEQKTGLVKQLNKMSPDARNNTLNSMAKKYLDSVGKPSDAKSIETQLNKWKLSGESKTYSPKK